MKNILKGMFSIFMAFVVFMCVSAFTDTKVETTKSLSFITKNIKSDFTLPAVNPVDVMLKKSAVEIVSIDTINISPIVITSTRIDKKPFDKLLRSIKKDPKVYTSNTSNNTIEMPKLMPLKPISAYITLLVPLPPILLKV